MQETPTASRRPPNLPLPTRAQKQAFSEPETEWSEEHAMTEGTTTDGYSSSDAEQIYTAMREAQAAVEAAKQASTSTAPETPLDGGDRRHPQLARTPLEQSSAAKAGSVPTAKELSIFMANPSVIQSLAMGVMGQQMAATAQAQQQLLQQRARAKHNKKETETVIAEEPG